MGGIHKNSSVYRHFFDYLLCSEFKNEDIQGQRGIEY